MYNSWGRLSHKNGQTNCKQCVLGKMSTCKCFYSWFFPFLDLFLKFYGPDSVGHIFLGKFPTWEVFWSFLYDNSGGSYKNGIKTMELITINTLILCMTLNGHWLAFVSPPGLNYMYVRPKFFRVMLSFTKDNKWLGFFMSCHCIGLKFLYSFM